MYDFKKSNGEWKISQIKKSIIRVDHHYDRKTDTRINLTGKKLRKVLTYTTFTPENNNKLEYVESIPLILQYQ